MPVTEADKIIDSLKLQPHPEGGYFAEVYRSEEKVAGSGLPDRYKGSRCFSTSIYFMLAGDQISQLHKLKSDETWHFYLGSTLLLHIIYPDGQYRKIIIGKNLPEETLQFTIPKECWFGAELKEKDKFGLVGCTVAPGFEFDDFELGDRKNLTAKFPDHKTVIEKFTSSKIT